jgi:phosphoribosylformylglycinamidine (FGAM) synthase-like amidotransferase family enzyme
VRVALVRATGDVAPLDGLAGEELVEHAGGALDADAVIVTGADDGALEALRAFARDGRPVLGIGGGFSALCAAGLLPGALEARAAQPAAPAPTHARVEGRATPFTWAIPAGRVVRLGGAPAARYLPPPELPALETAGRIVLRYCDAAGGASADGAAVAGVCDARGTVVGLLSTAGLGAQLIASLRLRLA